MKRKHGGKRDGAGRPAGSKKEPTKVVSTRLPLVLIHQHGIDAAWLLDAAMRKIAGVIANPPPPLQARRGVTKI